MKKTLLIYFLSDFQDSALNLYVSVKKLGLLDSKNIYSLIIFQSTKLNGIEEIIDLFDHKYNLNCYSDLYGYFSALKLINIDNFEYFIFMNSSCIGPIIPSYCELFNWDTLLTKRLINADLIAPIIEFPPPDDKNVENLKLLDNFSNLKKLYTIPFAHSYCLALNKKAIYCLLKNCAFPKSDIDRDLAVGTYERLITATLLNNNLNLESFLKKFNSIQLNRSNINDVFEQNFPKNHSKKNFSDPEIPHSGYFGTDLNPYEVLFFKNIRHQNSHRGKKQANISSNNLKFLDNIIGLNDFKLILNEKNEYSLFKYSKFESKKQNFLEIFLYKIFKLKN